MIFIQQKGTITFYMSCLYDSWFCMLYNNNWKKPQVVLLVYEDCFYRAMHVVQKRGIAIISRPSVRNVDVPDRGRIC